MGINRKSYGDERVREREKTRAERQKEMEMEIRKEFQKKNVGESKTKKD